MNLLRIFYPKNSLKRKILEIKEDIICIVNSRCKEKFRVEFHGAYDLHPENLAFWICIESDRMKKTLGEDQELTQQLRALLDKHDYPADARRSVVISFESQETVDRESNGDWYVHLK